MVLGKRKREIYGLKGGMIGPPTLKQYNAYQSFKKMKIPRNVFSYGKSSGELKWLDTQLAGTISTTGVQWGAPTGLNLIPQGTSENERIGRKCIIKTIQMRGFLTTATTNSNDNGNFYLVLDKQANKAYSLYTDVFQGASYLDFRNQANSQRFVVLKRFQFDIAGSSSTTVSGTGSASANSQQFNYYKKCNIPIEFTSTSGVIGEITSNNLLVFGASANSNTSAYSLLFRLQFIDG